MIEKQKAFYLKDSRNEIGDVGSFSLLKNVYNHPFLGDIEHSNFGIMTSTIERVFDGGFETRNSY